jgi:hypothetical protein
VRRWLIIIGILGFWAVMTASLVRRWLLEVRPTYLPGTYRSVLTPERRNYQTRMGIYIQSKSSFEKVGYTETALFYSKDGTYSITNTTRVRAPVMGLLERLAAFDLDTTAVIGQDQNLERLMVTLISPVVRAECRGHVISGKLVLRTRMGDEEETHEMALPSGHMVANGLSPLLALPPLRVGMRWSVAIVDPLTLQPSQVEIEVLRREPLYWEGEVWTTHVVEIRSDLMKAQAWVSPDGEVLKEKTLFGLTFIKERLPEVAGKGKEGEDADPLNGPR